MKAAHLLQTANKAVNNITITVNSNNNNDEAESKFSLMKSIRKRSSLMWDFHVRDRGLKRYRNTKILHWKYLECGTQKLE